VVTIHDLAYEVFPEAYGLFARWYLRYAARRAVAQATAIITPSEATKHDLIKVNQAPAAKITAIHHGFDAAHFSDTVTIPPEIRQLQPFFLMLGRLETRKNTARAIEAFGLMRQRNPEIKSKLILIGKPGFGYDAVQEAKAGLPSQLAQDIIELGYSDDAMVRVYMRAATTFLYPSLYEGFGIPLLEAMAAGSPIITSDISSNPEVVDDAAVLVDPESVEDVAQVMTIFATDKLSRDQVRERGKVRLNHFSWEKCATETHRVLLMALNAPNKVKE
jgi:glycosyltransferase involved in cell wall biosynthesis